MTDIIIHAGNGIRCSFCHKTRREVAHLIAAVEGPAICNECLTVSIEILAEALPCKPSQVYGVLMLRQAKQRSEAAKKAPL